MKTQKSSTKSLKSLSSLIAFMVLILSVLFISCDKDEIEKEEESIIPDRFKVDIPHSISYSSMKKSAKVDTLKGDDIYEMLGHFIKLGEDASELTEDIMFAIATLNLSQPLEVSFISDEDGREKHISIIENVNFEGKNWKYRLTLTDVEGVPAKSYSTNIGLQVFWNLSPIEGISILNFNNINRNIDEIFKDTYYRVDYSEAGNLGYEQHMFVTVTGIPMPEPPDHIFAVSKIKMFAGKNGDMVSIYGNSKHPNAQFFTDEIGFNWAFVAAASESLNIAVAEVGLPPVDLDADDRYTLLEEYSIYNVFRDQVLLTWPNIDPDFLADFLYYAQAPGYFDSNGFVQGSTAPSNAYSSLESAIEALTPYNPSFIFDMVVQFDE